MASTGTKELTYSKRGEGEGKRASYRASGDTLLEDSRTSGASEEEKGEWCHLETEGGGILREGV